MNAKTLLLITLAFFLWNCGGEAPTDEEKGEAPSAEVAENLQEAMPEGVEAVFNNDYVQVMKVRLEPGQQQPMHQGAPRVIYSLGEYTIQWTENGADKGAKSWEKGAVHWHEAGPHAAKNTGDQTAEYLVVARSETELPDCDEADLAEDVNQAAPDRAQILFENEHVRVTEVQLPTGASIPEHAGINRAIYALSDYQIDYTSDQEGAGAKTFRRGDAHWHEACKHALTNSGDTEAHFLVFAFKQ